MLIDSLHIIISTFPSIFLTLFRNQLANTPKFSYFLRQPTSHGVSELPGKNIQLVPRTQQLNLLVACNKVESDSNSISFIDFQPTEPTSLWNPDGKWYRKYINMNNTWRFIHESMGFWSSVKSFARQMQQDLQLSVVLELQASLAKKVPGIPGMLLEDGHHFFSGFFLPTISCCHFLRNCLQPRMN